MRRTILSVLILLLAAIPCLAWANLNVVATTPALAALAAEVGGSSASVRSLTSPAEDPHFVDARPDFVVALSRADVLITTGLDLEVGWLPTLQTQSRNAAIGSGGRGYVDASSGLALLEVAGPTIDRSGGDVHPGGNPHYLLDPRRAAQVALTLGARFAELDPTNAATFLANSAAVSARLDGLADDIATRFAALATASRSVVTYHRSFVYLADWLGLSVVVEVEPRPGVPPDPGHVATVLATMRSTGATVVLQETWYPTSTSNSLAQMAGGRVVTTNGGPDFEAGQTYADWIEALCDTIFAALAA